MQFRTPPVWLNGDDDGEYDCLNKNCDFSTDNEEYLNKHTEMFHNKERDMILYMCCAESIDGRNALNNMISNSFQPIDCTGGQAAFEDGDLKEFGDALVKASRETGYKLYDVYRMYDPGLGLIFDDWWVQAGVKAGTFKKYKIPDDVKAPPYNKNSGSSDIKKVVKRRDKQSDSDSVSDESDDGLKIVRCVKSPSRNSDSDNVETQSDSDASELELDNEPPKPKKINKKK
jgi:hypothetical protein